MTGLPTFPPLLRGEAVTAGADPFDRARALAALGCDGGTVVHNVQADRLRAAIVFAPEVPLEDAMAMLPVCGVGFQNALGALGPPEIAVHLTWEGGIRVNGAVCGRFRAAAATDDARAVPDWLVIGMDLAVMQTGDAPGRSPEVTSLYDEGCAEVDPVRLLESWARHTLVWINRWAEEGNGPLHDAWLGLVPDVGEEVARGGVCGRFLGVDERFGMLVRDGEATRLVALSSILEESP